MSPTTTPNGGKNGTRGKGEGLPLSLFFVGSRRDEWCVTHQKLWRGGSPPPACLVFWCGGRADAPPSRRAIESPASRPPDGRARLRAGLAGVARLASRAAAPVLNRGEGGGGASSCRWKSLLLFGGAPVSAAPVVAVSRRSWPTADGRCRVRRPTSPPGAGGAGVFRPLRRAGKDGKDSVKGNRQGSLSRSITRRSDQNRKIKHCFLFCDFASACQKSPFGLF